MEDAANDVPAGIAKSVIATTLLYGLPVLGILVVLPSAEATGLNGFPDALRQAMTVFGGSVHSTTSDGTISVSSHLTGLGLVLGWAMGILIAVVAFTSGLTWIMGSDRTLAVSCYDGAGPLFFGKFSARFGTPIRVNILSGVISTGVFVAGEKITSGNAYKFFEVGLNLAISTTLISYIGIFPAAWWLRRKRPDDSRPYKSPWLGLMTVLSMVAIIFCTVQILFPGLGDQWFGDSYRLDGWSLSEKWTYLFTELVPLLAFLAIAVAFWAFGRAHVAAKAREIEAMTSSTPAAV
jgi:amino acid transporter